MTKIAITGPVTGTGTYTLRAPDTASTLDFELPTVGTHLASAQADGMPLGTGGDPVVESGSNTDGDWTRWADGTQVVTRTIRNSITTNSSGFAEFGNYLFPVAFLTTPVISGTQVYNHNSLPARTASFGFSGDSGAPSLSNLQTGAIGIYTSGSSFTSVKFDCSVIATGRWK